MSRNRPCNEPGFTLVELLVAIAILVILATAGAPTLRDLIVDFRVAAAASAFERILRHARSEAVARRQIIRICPSRDGEFCDPATQWEHGWISYVDLDDNPERGPDDPLLRIRYGSGHLDIRFNAGHHVTINALGRISRNASMDFCAAGESHPGRRLVMIHSGRLRVESPSPGCRIL